MITIHLREDRRHIIDADVKNLMSANILPINLEIAATDEMLDIAIENKPHSVCFVPEKRLELTTETGLNVVQNFELLKSYIQKLKAKNILTTAFVDPEIEQIKAVKECNFDAIEIHTGDYANSSGIELGKILDSIKSSAEYAKSHGLEVHAGHGLTYENVPQLLQYVPEISCLNIGHFIVCEAVFVGLHEATRQMLRVMTRELCDQY